MFHKYHFFFYIVAILTFLANSSPTIASQQDTDKQRTATTPTQQTENLPEPGSFSQLTTELLTKTFTYLDGPNLLSAQLVCTDWGKATQSPLHFFLPKDLKKLRNVLHASEYERWLYISRTLAYKKTENESAQGLLYKFWQSFPINYDQRIADAKSSNWVPDWSDKDMVALCHYLNDEIELCRSSKQSKNLAELIKIRKQLQDFYPYGENFAALQCLGYVCAYPGDLSRNAATDPNYNIHLFARTSIRMRSSSDLKDFMIRYVNVWKKIENVSAKSHWQQPDNLAINKILKKILSYKQEQFRLLKNYADYNLNIAINVTIPPQDLGAFTFGLYATTRQLRAILNRMGSDAQLEVHSYVAYANDTLAAFLQQNLNRFQNTPKYQADMQELFIEAADEHGVCLNMLGPKASAQNYEIALWTINKVLRLPLLISFRKLEIKEIPVKEGATEEEAFEAFELAHAKARRSSVLSSGIGTKIQKFEIKKGKYLLKVLELKGNPAAPGDYADAAFAASVAAKLRTDTAKKQKLHARSAHLWASTINQHIIQNKKIVSKYKELLAVGPFLAYPYCITEFKVAAELLGDTQEDKRKKYDLFQLAAIHAFGFAQWRMRPLIVFDTTKPCGTRTIFSRESREKSLVFEFLDAAETSFQASRFAPSSDFSQIWSKCAWEHAAKALKGVVLQKISSNAEIKNLTCRVKDKTIDRLSTLVTGLTQLTGKRDLVTDFYLAFLHLQIKQPPKAKPFLDALAQWTKNKKTTPFTLDTVFGTFTFQAGTSMQEKLLELLNNYPDPSELRESPYDDLFETFPHLAEGSNDS